MGNLSFNKQAEQYQLDWRKSQKGGLKYLLSAINELTSYQDNRTSYPEMK